MVKHHIQKAHIKNTQQNTVYFCMKILFQLKQYTVDLIIITYYILQRGKHELKKKCLNEN